MHSFYLSEPYRARDVCFLELWEMQGWRVKVYGILQQALFTCPPDNPSEISDEQLIETALTTDHPFLEGFTLQRLQREGWVRLNVPHDWRPFAEGGFPTPSGKAEFYAASLREKGFDPLPTHTTPAGRESDTRQQSYPLVLITGKSLHFLNSSYAHSSRHLKAEGEQPQLEIHPSDAKRRGLKHLSRVRVFNEQGEVIVQYSLFPQMHSGYHYLHDMCLPFQK